MVNNDFGGEEVYEKVYYMCDWVLFVMYEVCVVVDKFEGIMSFKYWLMFIYWQMLFVK